MSVLVVDTSNWISYFNFPAQKSDSTIRNQHHKEIDLALSESRVFMPGLVAAELLSAKMSASLRHKLIDFIKELPECETSLNHWLEVGKLRANLASKGFNISTPDAHIAQCSIDLNAYLLSEDKIFSKIATFAKLQVL